jgi:hypothetical protein
MADDLVVICEAAADQRTASALADRVICERIDWIEPETLDSFRRYRGLYDNEPFFTWTDLKKEARERGIKVHGHRENAPRPPDGAMAEKALRLFATLPQPPSAVLLVRDTDKERNRRAGFEQARKAERWPFVVVIGVAEAKRECWILAGYEPRNGAEHERLTAARKELGFDPREEAERLTASEPGAKHDAKRALRTLTEGDAEREHACVEDTPLEILKQRGEASGLAAYLSELEKHLVPLFDPSRARRPPASSATGDDG